MRDPRVQPEDTIACWFSCGAASAVAAKKTVELYGDIAKIRVVNNPVVEEHEDNQRFLKDVEKWLGIKIETAVNTKYPSCSAVDVWNTRKYMSGVAGAPCTLELKREARRQWESANPTDWLVLGFTSNEKKRSDAFQKEERLNLLPILVELGISKSDCFTLLLDAGIKLPAMYHLGYPNANCIGCVKASSPTYWNHVRRTHPTVFEERAAQSREIGAKLVRVKGKRIYLDELSPDAVGAPLKNLSFECGSFCEEYTETTSTDSAVPDDLGRL